MMYQIALITTLMIASAAMIGDAEARNQPAQGEVRDALLVVNKLGDTLSIINPETGRERARVAVGEGPHEVAASPDGRIAVVTNYGRQTPGRSLSVVNVITGEVIRTIDLEQYHRPHGVIALPDGKRFLVTAEQEKKLLIVDVEAGKVTAAIDTDQDISHMVALTPDHRYACVPNIRSGSVSIIDLREKELAKIVETGPGAEGVAAHPTRPEVWISNRAADTVSIIDTNTKEVVATLESQGFPIRVAISPNGRHALVVNARAGIVAVFDVEKRSLLETIAMDAEVIFEEGRMFPRAFSETTVPIGVIFNPEGTRAYVALTRSDVVMVIDTATWEVVEKYETDKEPDGLGWSRIEREETAGQQDSP